MVILRVIFYTANDRNTQALVFTAPGDLDADNFCPERIRHASGSGGDDYMVEFDGDISLPDGLNVDHDVLYELEGEIDDDEELVEDMPASASPGGRP